MGGFDVRDVGLRGKSDKEVILFTKQNKAVLFSGDWDFANILTFPPQEYYGIVILDFPNEVSPRFIARETRKALSKIPFNKFRGNLIIIEAGRIRMRS